MLTYSSWPDVEQAAGELLGVHAALGEDQRLAVGDLPEQRRVRLAALQLGGTERHHPGAALAGQLGGSHDPAATRAAATHPAADLGGVEHRRAQADALHVVAREGGDAVPARR